MTNPYHDAEGRFTSRTGQVANVNRAIQEGSFTSYLAEKEALQEADQISGYVETSNLRKASERINSNLNDEIADRDRAISTGDLATVEAFIDERVNRPGFLNTLNERDRLMNVATELKTEYDFMLKNAETHPELPYEEVRKKGLALLDVNETLQGIRNELNEYKDVTAVAAATVSELTRQKHIDQGTYLTYEEHTLNDLEELGEYASGSREWLESRQNGIGGSDVGKIIGADTQWAAQNYISVLTSKTEPITDEQVESQGNNHVDYSGALGRGNAWEDNIAFQFAENNPHLRVAHCKTSWRNKNNPFQYANFDGLTLDENGQPDGILEIKTSSVASSWGPEGSGIEGIPAGYRAQVLWYMQAADVKNGHVAVLIDDREYREYHFTLTPELEKEQKSNLEAATTFWSDVTALRDGTYTPAAPTTPRRLGGFSKTVLNSDLSSKTPIFKEAAVYREQTPAQVRSRFNKLCPKKDRQDPEKVRAALTKLYTEFDPSTRKRPIVGFDIETNHTAPTKGRVIESGISTYNPDGTKNDRLSQLYGLTKRSIAANGTGVVDVHGITEGKIAKKATFEHPRSQKALLEKLKAGTVLAHNATFEKKWMRLHLAGFAEAERKGQIRILDTMTLSRRLLNEEVTDHTLNSFVEHHGIPYENAHRAFNDADMMTEAFLRFSNQLHQKDTEQG